MGTFGDLFLGLLAVLFPPIAVWIKRGICSLDSLLNILLCILGYLPGLIHAWYIIAKYPDEYERIHHADENGRVSYYYVSHDQQQHRPAGPGSGAPDGGRAHREQQRSYGTTGGQQNASQPANPAQVESGPSSGEPRAPPSYADAVKGDNKVQTP